jgi:hypothetical protein
LLTAAEPEQGGLRPNALAEGGAILHQSSPGLKSLHPAVGEGVGKEVRMGAHIPGWIQTARMMQESSKPIGDTPKASEQQKSPTAHGNHH